MYNKWMGHGQLKTYALLQGLSLEDCWVLDLNFLFCFVLFFVVVITWSGGKTTLNTHVIPHE